MTKQMEVNKAAAEMPLAEQVSVESNKKKIWRYVHSSIITILMVMTLFFGIFIPMFHQELKGMGLDVFLAGGLVGIGGVAVRILWKAFYEFLIVYLPKLIVLLPIINTSLKEILKKFKETK